jgi:ABC-2 type transport system permease protein
MSQMISRDFKVKYKRSVLGVLWSLLYPLLMMSVMALVFSHMFKFSMEGVNYLVYLMTGLVMFNYFSEASNTAMTSIVSNFSLMTKVYIPKYIFPLSKCLFVSINFLLSLIPLLLIVVITGAPISIYYIFLPYVFICLLIFTIGIGFIMSSISVFLRDMFYIYGIILTIWNYFTPVFYDIHILPQKLQVLFKFNPLYQYITFARTILLDAKIPDLGSFIWCGFSSIVVFFIGCLIFKKNQDKFIYYV